MHLWFCPNIVLLNIFFEKKQTGFLSHMKQYPMLYIAFFMSAGVAITPNPDTSNDFGMLHDPDFMFRYINMSDNVNQPALVASCITGLGPSDDDLNHDFGAWYFNGERLPIRSCDANTGHALQPRKANIARFVGAINLFQCRGNIFAEGVYSCKIMNSSMMYDIRRLGVYEEGRSKNYCYSL